MKPGKRHRKMLIKRRIFPNGPAWKVCFEIISGVLRRRWKWRKAVSKNRFRMPNRRPEANLMRRRQELQRLETGHGNRGSGRAAQGDSNRALSLRGNPSRGEASQPDRWERCPRSAEETRTRQQEARKRANCGNRHQRLPGPRGQALRTPQDRTRRQQDHLACGRDRKAKAGP